MEGQEKVSMWINKYKNENKNRFNHGVYVNLLRINSLEAEKYIKSFEKDDKTQLVIEQKWKQDILEKWDDINLTEESKTTLESLNKSQLDEIVINKEEMAELRKIYEEKFNKKPFVWWDAQKLIEKINKV